MLFEPGKGNIGFKDSWCNGGGAGALLKDPDLCVTLWCGDAVGIEVAAWRDVVVVVVVKAWRGDDKTGAELRGGGGGGEVFFVESGTGDS